MAVKSIQVIATWFKPVSAIYKLCEFGEMHNPPESLSSCL
jgi:hypothetical protein